MGLWRVVKGDLLRVLKSPRPYIALLMMVFLLWMGIWDDFVLSHSDVVYYYGLAHITIFPQIVLTLSASLCAVFFCEEWNSKAFWQISLRLGVKRYCYGRCISTILSGGLMAMLGETLFFLSLITQRPLFYPEEEGARVAMPQLAACVREKDFVTYFVLSILMSFFSYSLFALAALVVSTWLPNRFVTMVSPMIIWFSLGVINQLFSVPLFLDVPSLMLGYGDMGNCYAWFVYTVLISILLYVLLSKLCYIGICRRIEK